MAKHDDNKIPEHCMVATLGLPNISRPACGWRTSVRQSVPQCRISGWRHLPAARWNSKAVATLRAGGQRYPR